MATVRSQPVVKLNSGQVIDYTLLAGRVPTSSCGWISIVSRAVQAEVLRLLARVLTTVLSFSRATQCWCVLGYAVVVYLCVCARQCLFVTRRYCIEMVAQTELLFACRFPSTYRRLCFMDMGISPKITLLYSGTWSQSLANENLATTIHHQLCRQAQY